MIEVTEKELEEAIIDLIKTCDRDTICGIARDMFGGLFRWYERNKGIESERDYIYILTIDDQYRGAFGWGDEVEECK